MIYDSVTSDMSEAITFISGAHPSLLFEVTILDAFGQKVSQANNAYVIQILLCLNIFLDKGSLRSQAHPLLQVLSEC